MFSLFNFQVIVMTIAVSLLVPFLVLRLLFYAIKKINQKSLKTVAFFHPNCCDGGGGERVFWSFINTFLTKIKLDDDTSIIIYCGHTDKTSDDIFNMVEVRIL